ncbi:hypothetical protein AVL63_02955 [Nesterenkonia jeotgali]|uniref:Uncharacterized protein n=1 Tax=Nesterenkonia jeotgali TaxID=317018 RepID=A0A0W8IGL6_9MICC|nr:hypothetical protein AVL63_02955 [Nesterenkonia jeotgali]
MRAATVDQRRFHAPAVPVLLTGSPDAATLQATGEPGPDGRPVYRLQAADPAPSNWSWGYFMQWRPVPVLEVGTVVAVTWSLRASRAIERSLDVTTNSATNGTQLSRVNLTTGWQTFRTSGVALRHDTSSGHSIRVQGFTEPGFWIESTAPLLEVVRPAP